MTPKEEKIIIRLPKGSEHLKAEIQEKANLEGRSMNNFLVWVLVKFIKDSKNEDI